MAFPVRRKDARVEHGLTQINAKRENAGRDQEESKSEHVLGGEAER